MSGRPWAICEGGLIQDASPDVEHIDLDWLQHVPYGDADIDEAERCYRLLARITANGENPGWLGYLVVVRAQLETAYAKNGVPEGERVWHENHG